MVSPETYIEGPWSMGMIIPNAVEHEKKQISKAPTSQLLVGGFNPSEKYSSVGMIIPNVINYIRKPTSLI